MTAPLICIIYTGTETISLSTHDPIAIQILLGGPSPNLGEGVELGVEWYPVELLHIRYNLFAGTEMLSLSVYEPIAMQIFCLGAFPPMGGGVEL